LKVIEKTIIIIRRPRSEKSVFKEKLANLFGSAHKLVLFLDSLESAVTVFGGSIDELEIDGLVVSASVSNQQRLAESHCALSRASDATLNHEPILIDFTVVGESTNRSDALFGKIRFSGSRFAVTFLADSKDVFVDLGTVVVALLTSAGNSEADAGRMPCSDTSDLAETSVSLARKTSDAPSTHHTSVSVTASGSADIDRLAFAEHLGNFNLLLEQSLGKVNLLVNVATVDLDFQEVGNLLSEFDLADLGVSKNANHLAVLLDSLQLGFNFLRLLGSFLGVLGESLLLGLVPVLVESALDVFREMGSPDGGEGAEAGGSGNVSNNADDDKRRGLKDSNSLNSFFLVEFGTRTFDFSDDVGHTCLVSDKGCQVRSSSSIVLGERSNATTVVLRSLLGKILKGAVARSFEFTVRHLLTKF